MLIWSILLTCRNTQEFNERENILILKNNETQEKTTQTYLQVSDKSIIPFEKTYKITIIIIKINNIY